MIVVTDPAPSRHRGHLIGVGILLANVLIQALDDDPKVEVNGKEQCRCDNDYSNDTTGQSEYSEDCYPNDDEDDSNDGQHDGDHWHDEPGEQHATAAGGRAPDEHHVNDDEKHLKANDAAQDSAIVLNWKVSNQIVWLELWFLFLLTCDPFVRFCFAVTGKNTTQSIVWSTYAGIALAPM